MSEIKDIRERLEAATDGPWEYQGAILFGPNEDGTGIALDNPADAPFIANAPSDIEFLLARIAQLESDYAKSDKALRLRAEALAILGREHEQLEAQAQKLVENVRDVAGQQFLNWRALLGKHCDAYESALAQKKAGEA